MAKSTITVKSITLELSTREASYLMGMLQNPPCHPEDEPKIDQECRSAIWSELSDSLAVKSNKDTTNATV